MVKQYVGIILDIVGPSCKFFYDSSYKKCLTGSDRVKKILVGGLFNFITRFSYLTTD